AFTPYLGAAICARHSVYARSELPEPSHQVETALLPSGEVLLDRTGPVNARRGHPSNTLGSNSWERLQRCRRAESLLLRVEAPGAVMQDLASPYSSSDSESVSRLRVTPSAYAAMSAAALRMAAFTGSGYSTSPVPCTVSTRPISWPLWSRIRAWRPNNWSVRRNTMNRFPGSYRMKTCT